MSTERSGFNPHGSPSLGTSVIKVNDHFTLNVVLVDKHKYKLLSVFLLMLICMCFFATLVREFLILLAIMYVVFLALGRFSS
jgi:hypothetical protein